MRRGLTATIAATIVAALMPLAVFAAVPVAVGSSLTVPVDGELTATLVARDDAAGAVGFEVVAAPGHGTLGSISAVTCSTLVAIANADRECWAKVSYTPDAAYEGPDAFTYRATDPGQSATVTVDIDVAASASVPVGNADPGIAVIEDLAATTPDAVLLLNDTDADGDTLTARVGSQPAHATVTVLPSGAITVDPDPDYFTSSNDDPFTYYVSDGVTEVGPIDASLHVFWVDDAPSFSLAGTDVPVAEDAGAQTITDWVTDVRSGPTNEESFEEVRFIVTTDNDALFSVLPAVATVTDPGPGATSDLTFTTAPDANGAATVSIHADDRPNNDPVDPMHEYASSTVTFTITVSAVNDAPTITFDTDPSIDILEDALAAIPPGTIAIGDIDAHDAPPLGRVLEATLTATGGTMSIDVPPSGLELLAGDGTDDGVLTMRGELPELNAAIATLDFLPAPDVFGDASIRVDVSDLGAYGSGGAKTASATLALTIDPANDPPSFTKGPNVQAVVGRPITVTDWATAISPGPFETDGLTFTVEPADGSLFTVAPSIDGDGDLTFTTSAAEGSTVVDVTLADDHPFDPLESPTQQFTITVTDGPAADAQAVTVEEDSGANPITLTGSDPEDDPLDFAIADGPSHGTLTGDAPDLTYTPDANWFGADSFTFTVDDGETVSPEATVSITVTAVNDAPDAKSDAVSVKATVTTVFDLFKANGGGADSAGPGESAADLVITSVSSPSKGTATIVNGGTAVSYDPAGCSTGSDVFTYTVSDGEYSDSASVVVTINRPNQGGNSTSPITDVPAYTFITNSTMGTTVPVRLSWCGVTTSGTSVKSYKVLQSTNAGSSYSSTLYSATTAKSKDRNLSTNTSYRWRVRTVDTANRTGSYRQSPATRITRYQNTSSTITYAGTWGTATAGSPSGGSQQYTTSAGATASITVTNKERFAIVGAKSTTRGSFRVYVDNVLVATVSAKTSSSTVNYRRVLYHRALTSGTGVSHTIRVEAVGNGRVDLDSILTLGAP